MSIPVAIITPSGMTVPSYSDILLALQAVFQSIYGTDVVLTPDSQDGQLLAIFAAALNDSNQTALATYSGVSPSYAQGAALSSYVKINGIERKTASSSSVVLTLTGVTGTVVVGGVAKDIAGNFWSIIDSVTIPGGGTITANAICQTIGAVVAAPGDINQIYTPVLGWQTVTNVASAVPGLAVETDAQLRIRQAASVSLPAQTPMQAILSAIANLPGVLRRIIYENSTGSPNGDGVPGHSISVVVEGGVAADIAQAIEKKKCPGTGTYGTTTVNVSDPAGLIVPINFYELDYVGVYVSLTILSLPGYVASTKDLIQQTIMDFLNNLEIGEDVYYAWVNGIASLITSPLGQTFKITALTTGTAPTPVGTADITVPFNKAASTALANIVITVT